jgi:hypothetical protein
MVFRHFYQKTVAVIDEIVAPFKYFTEQEFCDSLFFTLLSLMPLLAAGALNHNAKMTKSHFGQMVCVIMQLRRFKAIWETFCKNLKQKETSLDILFCDISLYMIIEYHLYQLGK